MRRLISTACAIIVIAGMMAPASIASETVKGDRRAYAEVTAAFKKLLALPGYRVHQTIYRGATLIIEATYEIVPPDSFHVISRMSSTTQVEVWKTGSRSRARLIERDVPGRWECRSVPLLPPVDRTSLTGDVEFQPARESTIDGLPAREYHYKVRYVKSGQREEGRVALWVNVKTGLPREYLQTLDDGAQMVMDFYDYGARITLQLPPCS